MNPSYITISQVNNYIKSIIDQNIHLKKVYLKGEISNFKNHTSGHLYFTLKDDESRLSAIMFKSAASTLSFRPEDGMNVLVTGRISVYPAGGNYQIYIERMEPDGLGNLYIEYEKLKRKLQSEGLFDQSKKKPIPKYPTKIGIVTAPTGAAIKDILSTIKRRYPLCETILFPALVQGMSAGADIARKIYMAQDYDCDVLIVGRGGGSIEDLWAFNEEIVARAIYESKIPIISAVGHEVDFTIADFVADMRAPTPTGAAEMAVPTISEVKNIVKTKKIELAKIIGEKVTTANHSLKKLAESYVLKNPMMLYEMKIQKLDGLNENLNKTIQKYIDVRTTKLNHLKENYVLTNPHILYEKKKQTFTNLVALLDKNSCYYIEKKSDYFLRIIEKLKLVNPLNILEKGYAIVKKDDTVLVNSKNIRPSDILDVRLFEGELKVDVK